MLFATPIAHKVRSYKKAGAPAAIAFANPESRHRVLLG